MTDIDTRALALRVVAEVCHKDQMVVWSSEVAEALQEYISDDLDYSDIVALHSAIERELRDIVRCVLEHPETERALAAFLREAVSPWKPIDDEARQADRILIAWAPFGNIREHVELGWWSYHARAWVNTYGKPFTGDPDVWMPLPIFALPTPPAAGGGE